MRKNRLITLLILSLGALGLTVGKLIPVLKRNAYTEVAVMEADPCSIVSSVYFKGTVCSAGSREICTAEQARIVNVCSDIGDSVRAGDVILEAEPTADGFSDYSEISRSVVSVFQELYGLASDRTEKVYCLSENGRMIVKTPIDGIICSLPVKEGDIIAAGALCAAVVDQSRLQVVAHVPETYIQDLREGMSCEITGESFREKIYAGTVQQIMPFAAAAQSLGGTGNPTVDVVISIDKPDKALRTGCSARVEVFTDVRDKAIVVPYEAVGQDDNNREYIFVVQNGCAFRHSIEIGEEMEYGVEVISGIEPGEWIVLDRDMITRDGMTVRAVIV